MLINISVSLLSEVVGFFHIRAWFVLNDLPAASIRVPMLFSGLVCTILTIA